MTASAPAFMKNLGFAALATVSLERKGYGWSELVSTTSKFEPETWPSVCSWSFDQPRFGAPVMYQSEPLSATIIP